MRSAHLSLIDRRARIPSTSSGSSWSACASDSSSWSRPLASPRHHSRHRSARCAPSSLRSPSSACLLLSTGVLRSTLAAPCGEPPRRQRSRAHIRRERRGKAVRPDSCRNTTTREAASVPAATLSPSPTVSQQPPTGRIPCPEGLGAHAGFHAARLRPSDPKPAPALLGRAGSHAGRRPARAATLFRVLRPMRSAREQREKLTSGYLHLHARLRFLPCRRARAACDSRGARHATGAGLRV